MKPSCCFGDFLWIFQFCVISAGLYCNEQKPTLANLAKKEVNGRIRQFTEKLKYLLRARPETRRMSGLSVGKTEGKLQGSSVRMVYVYFKTGHPEMVN